MKRSTWKIRRRLATVMGALTSMLGTTPAFAGMLEDDPWSGPVPAAPTFSATSGDGFAWAVPVLVVAAAIALTAMLVGAIRERRGRGIAVDARA